MPTTEYKERITEAFRILMGCARRKESITYGNLGERLGVRPQAVGPYLDLIVLFCKMNGWPDITVLAVSSTTGRPSEGYWGSPNLMDKARGSVFVHPWNNIEPTSIVDVMERQLEDGD